MSSSHFLLTTQSNEITALKEIIPPSCLELSSSSLYLARSASLSFARSLPSSLPCSSSLYLGWISFSCTPTSISFADHLYPLPKKNAILKNALATIKSITFALSGSMYFSFPLQVCYSKKGVKKTLSISHPTQVVQLLSSAISYLRTELLYYLQSKTLIGETKLFILHQTLPHLPHLEEALKVTFLYLQKQLPISSPISLTIPSLTTLATLAVLKTPFPLSNNTSNSVSENAPLNLLTITKLSPLLRSIFKNNSLPYAAQECLALNIEPTENYDLFLTPVPSILSPLYLMSCAQKQMHSTAIKVTIQKQILRYALALPSINPSPSLMPIQTLENKLLGPNLFDIYESLSTLYPSFISAFARLTKEDDLLINVLFLSLSKILTSLSHQSTSNTEIIQLKYLPFRLKNSFILLLNVYDKLIMHSNNSSSLKKEQLIKWIDYTTLHTSRSIHYLVRITSIDHDPWVNDFLLELKNTFTKIKNALESKASDFGISLSLEEIPSFADPCTYPHTLPTEYLSDAIPVPISHSCLKPFSTESSALPSMLGATTTSSLSTNKHSHRVTFNPDLTNSRPYTINNSLSSSYLGCLPNAMCSLFKK
ncbi:hypothetical protein CLAVI_000123 [Candidatus Clavichlamydia salmonicola]|uniref:hypothetical protein n=1 Tax=Candidatus Clavichlamydia salmonicola TaxID=469812 RepID=UPI0018913CD6|nr:hypothetical protein [Candidatus Clavichlamydia salmonicola]MBF5050517.1 hypothetical protein [Candidatus Clavichlamydia salmonicola]